MDVATQHPLTWVGHAEKLRSLVLVLVPELPDVTKLAGATNKKRKTKFKIISKRQ